MPHNKHKPETAQFPTHVDVARYTDKYFSRTREIVTNFGDAEVTYAVFLRRPVVYAAGLALSWLKKVATERGLTVKIHENYKEGEWVGAGEPLFYMTGPFAGLSDLETVLLQKIGPTCVAAYNAAAMCKELPNVSFLAMDARHCTGPSMTELMAYAAAVGSRAAQREANAKGFIGSSTDAVAPFFGQEKGLGTMPHALIGYAGSTVRAAEMFYETYPEEKLIVLVDYYGQEITDSLAVCNRFPELAKSGNLLLRLDTHGGRFIEGLDTQESYDVFYRNAKDTLRKYRTDRELKNMIGTGVSAAAIWHLREKLDENGFNNVGIVASSGFSVEKCRAMADANAPIDMVGTGSFLPQEWPETYATADIIAYDGEPRVKTGREFLLRKWMKHGAD